MEESLFFFYYSILLIEKERNYQKLAMHMASHASRPAHQRQRKAPLEPRGAEGEKIHHPFCRYKIGEEKEGPLISF